MSEAATVVSRLLSQPLIVADDPKHSEIESRWYALAQTNEGRKLFVVFTIRGTQIAMSSSPDMKSMERRGDEKAPKKTVPEFSSEEMRREF